MSDNQRRFLKISRGLEPADILLRNGRIINVFSGRIESADIAIADGRIAGVGEGYSAKKVLDLAGAYVAPGLIDAHVHIESSLCTPAEFASAVVPRGVTTAVIDPHEIANVAGLAGVRYMAEASRGLTLRIEIMAPSCVPATHLATAGATLNADDLAALLADSTAHGLAEVMNFPGVLLGDEQVIAKLKAFTGRPIDGHAPGVLGRDLCAYIAAGIGSDHECVSVAEAQEKLDRGLYILIREATNAHNLQTLLPLITPGNARRICFCTDDRQPADLLDEGSIDHMVRVAIGHGIDPVTAFQMATINSAEWFGLHDRGAIGPGRVADLMIFDDLAAPTAKLVFARGKKFTTASSPIPVAAPPTHQRDLPKTLDLKIKALTGRIRVIGHRPDQLITDHLQLPATIVEGCVVADSQRDVLKIAVVNRHGSSTFAIGFIQGIGLKRGAIAGTVAHDHHNIVCIGADDASMLSAMRNLQTRGGGLIATHLENVIATLPLPVAGLMSDQPIASVRKGYDSLLVAARELGSPLHDPFMAMSFSALEVIPSLKLTDLGLVDVERFELVDLFV